MNNKTQRKMKIKYTPFLLSIALTRSDSFTNAETRKILALHGGGGDGYSFCESLNNSILPALLDASSQQSHTYEFICPDGGYSASFDGLYLWVPDPPCKCEPTTDPDVAIESVNILDAIIESESEGGGFYGILGYSQGSMFTTYYLSRGVTSQGIEISFEVALMFAGYLPTTHIGLLNSITDNENNIFSEASTISSSTNASLVWAGGQDPFYCMTLEQAEVFEDGITIINEDSGHIVPDSSDSTFDMVIDFIENSSQSSTVSFPEDTPSSENCVMKIGLFSFLTKWF